MQGTIQKCQATINYYKTLQTTAFEDYADGCISKQEYLTRKQVSSAKLEEETHRLSELYETGT